MYHIQLAYVPAPDEKQYQRGQPLHWFLVLRHDKKIEDTSLECDCDEEFCEHFDATNFEFDDDGEIQPKTPFLAYHMTYIADRGDDEDQDDTDINPYQVECITDADFSRLPEYLEENLGQCRDNELHQALDILDAIDLPEYPRLAGDDDDDDDDDEDDGGNNNDNNNTDDNNDEHNDSNDNNDATEGNDDDGDDDDDDDDDDEDEDNENENDDDDSDDDDTSTQHEVDWAVHVEEQSQEWAWRVLYAWDAQWLFRDWANEITYYVRFAPDANDSEGNGSGDANYGGD